MATLNNFKDWLEEVELENYEQSSDLVHSLRNVCECGLFKTQVANGTNNGWIVTASGTDDSLHLFTAEQITAFIRHIEDTHCEGIDAEIYASMQYANEKDD